MVVNCLYMYMDTVKHGYSEHAFNELTVTAFVACDFIACML